MKTTEQIVKELSIVTNFTEGELKNMPITAFVKLMNAHGITFNDDKGDAGV